MARPLFSGHKLCELTALALFSVGSVPCGQAGNPASWRAVERDPPQEDALETALARIRRQVSELLGASQPALYARHLRSVLALCEADVLRLRFAGPDRAERGREVLGYLKTIESGLVDDRGCPDTYLMSGRQALTLARLSRMDDTLQFYIVRLPPHWSPSRAYPLHVQLHGRGPGIPLAYVSDTFLPHPAEERQDDDVITVVPWLRGNGQWREENGSEPDVWEAIDDVKSFATLDEDRWYISGHSWGGDDVWAIVQRTPDLWAAAAIMAGNPSGAPAGLGLVPNASQVPFYLWLGDQDQERRPAFDAMRAALTAVGNTPTLVVAPGVGHAYRPEDAAALQAWLLEHGRRVPRHFSFVVDTAQHRGIWGVTIPRKYPWAYLQAEPKAFLECWIDGPRVRVRISNASSLDVDLGPQGLRMKGNVELVVNGKRRFTGPAPQKPISLKW